MHSNTMYYNVKTETQDKFILKGNKHICICTVCSPWPIIEISGRGVCLFLFFQTDNKIDTFQINGHWVYVIS